MKVKPFFTASANSGRNEGLNNPSKKDEPDIGPTPSDNYTIDLSNNAEPDKTQADGSGWGLYGWKLDEILLTKIKLWLFTNRGGGFYLHQDQYRGNARGTAGCIGILGSKNIRKMKSLLEKYSKNNKIIYVIVDYQNK